MSETVVTVARESSRVTVAGPEAVVTVSDSEEDRVVVVPGGYQGLPGTPGLGSGGGAGASIVYTQASPAASWPIEHNLGRFPGVSVVVGLEAVLADVTYIDVNHLVVVFAVPTAGTATLF